MLTGRQLLTAAIAAGGVWYMIPSLHQKYNIESNFDHPISDQTAQQIGIGMIVLALILNAQPTYTLHRIKALDFLSSQRLQDKKSIESFCGLVDQMNGPQDLDF